VRLLYIGPAVISLIWLNSTVNPKQFDERSLQIDLLRLDWAVPIAGCV
jgi:hypothetical protein